MPVVKSEGGRMPWEIIKIAFPLEVVEMVKRFTPAGPADAFLVAAVMREESTFNPVAVSKTGALGLMQIMPETAEFIAGKTGHTRLDRDGLLDPALNIKFGSWYLAPPAG